MQRPIYHKALWYENLNIQTLLRLSQWCETENPMFGLTTNPLNPKFTPGGSTGGEGALLAMHGSLIGWGTDIGGSVRIPSHINGLYGLKPTVCSANSLLFKSLCRDRALDCLI